MEAMVFNPAEFLMGKSLHGLPYFYYKDKKKEKQIV
jgi:hypothetical protein